MGDIIMLLVKVAVGLFVLKIVLSLLGSIFILSSHLLMPLAVVIAVIYVGRKLLS